jgi:hypothetical protein
MRIYRIAAMFQTFGLEDKLVNSFDRHYKNFLRRVSNPTVRRKELRDFNKSKLLHLGSSNIGDALKSIVEHYGSPQLNLPNRILFALSHPMHPTFKGGANAYFGINEENGVFYIVKPAADPLNVSFDYDFENTIAHEVQHFLRSLYEGGLTGAHTEGQGEMARYYGNPWEIQAYAANIARNAVDSIKTVFEVGLKNKTPERIDYLKENAKRNKDQFAKSFLLKSVINFFQQTEEETGEKFSEDLRKQYYQASLRDFSKLFDQLFA